VTVAGDEEQGVMVARDEEQGDGAAAWGRKKKDPHRSIKEKGEIRFSSHWLDALLDRPDALKRRPVRVQ
jgi:hypothetical protein